MYISIRVSLPPSVVVPMSRLLGIMLGDSSDRHSCRAPSGIWWVEAGDAAKHPAMHGAMPTAQLSRPRCQECQCGETLPSGKRVVCQLGQVSSEQQTQTAPIPQQAPGTGPQGAHSKWKEEVPEVVLRWEGTGDGENPESPRHRALWEGGEE